LRTKAIAANYESALGPSSRGSSRGDWERG
jgi:hypothetical protein